MGKEKIATTEQFLKKLADDQKPLSKQMTNLETLQKRIESIFKKGLGENLILYFGGSPKRGMIKEDFDINIVIYWPTNTDEDLMDIHKKVGKFVKKKLKKGRAKNLGWAVPYRENFTIDVIPGILTDPEKKYADFYDSTTEDAINTSIEVQEDFISNSERMEIIRLMKLWKLRKKVPINSFILELMTIAGCRGINRTQMEKQVMKMFKYLKENLEKNQVVDPAKQSNILSNLMSQEEIEKTIELVQDALNSKTWNKVFK